MKQLEEMVELLVGHFDNRNQYAKMQEQGRMDYPYAKHVNSLCNEKIMGLPKDFDGYFVLEESEYEIQGKTNRSSHLFLFTQEEKGIKLTSYELSAKDVTFADFQPVNYDALKESAKFTPAYYVKKEGIYEGGSVSHFSPVLTFTLFERFSPEWLEVSEMMEVNGKRTFGYDEPIIYERVAQGD
ncbi:MAG TPA: hypothetical protein IAD15_00340 [Candidatus Fimiplasma intestinipullorum]|uniref:Uncharacterized protein n=1 Tax=Candidatus Fimiplasma intestinipullorum TaxID=2840825 RepID=A0A9D1HKU6_9FIRM|nr:hypothetical protein [Candidatus Fimiplasma intestinipullorum]